MNPLTLSVDEAARMVGCSDDAIYRVVHRGDLPHVKIGKRGIIRVHREGLETWLRDLAATGGLL